MDIEFLFILAGFVILGLFTGFCAGLLGIGGGLILVPGLYYFLKYTGIDVTDDDILIHTALATSMAIIVPTGLSSSWAQIKRKAVDWEAVKLMTPGLVIGVIVGILLVSKMDSHILKIIFAVGMVGIALSIIFKEENAIENPLMKKMICAFPSSLGIGIFATFLGIGGAVLNVPYLNKAGIPLKTAIASGSVLGVVIATIATLGYLIMGEGTFGLINPMACLLIIPASVLMAPIGVRTAHYLPVSKLKIIFATLLVIVAAKMVFEVI